MRWCLQMMHLEFEADFEHDAMNYSSESQNECRSTGPTKFEVNWMSSLWGNSLFSIVHFCFVRAPATPFIESRPFLSTGPLTQDAISFCLLGYTWSEYSCKLGGFPSQKGSITDFFSFLVLRLYRPSHKQSIHGDMTSLCVFIMNNISLASREIRLKLKIL